MATTKIWQIKCGLSQVIKYASNPEKTKLSDLEQVIRYASDKSKTADEDEQFYAVTGINCGVETAIQEMQSVQERFGKTGGNVAYHAYQSFKTGEVTAEQCHRLGVELARKMWGDKYQVLVATHYNTGTFHNHLVLNAVGMWDGKKYDCSKREYYRMRRLSDEMCAREGLTVIEHPKKRAPRPIYIAEKNGEPTKYNLMREAIDRALHVSISTNDFVYAMKKQGYFVYLNTDYKYATIRSYNAKRGTRLYRLGEQYDRDAIFGRIEENSQYDRQGTIDRFNDMFYQYSYEWVYANPPKKDYYKRKEFYDLDIRRASLLEIYVVLFVLILDLAVEIISLAIELLLPETTVPGCMIAADMKAKSPEVLEASRSFERYSRQVILMSEEKFKTVDEVREYISKRELDIADFKKYREHFRNKLRNEKDPKKIREYREKRDSCTQMLSHLRKQKETAQTILNDIPKVRKLLEAEKNIQRGTDPYEIANGYIIRDAKNEKESITR